MISVRFHVTSKKGRNRAGKKDEKRAQRQELAASRAALERRTCPGCRRLVPEKIIRLSPGTSATREDCVYCSGRADLIHPDWRRKAAEQTRKYSASKAGKELASKAGKELASRDRMPSKGEIREARRRSGRAALEAKRAREVAEEVRRVTRAQRSRTVTP